MSEDNLKPLPEISDDEFQQELKDDLASISSDDSFDKLPSPKRQNIQQELQELQELPQDSNLDISQNNQPLRNIEKPKESLADENGLISERDLSGKEEQIKSQSETPINISRESVQKPTDFNTTETFQPKPQISTEESQSQETVSKTKDQVGSNWLKMSLKFIAVVIGSFIFIYLFINFPAIYSKLLFYYKELTGEKAQVEKIIPASSNTKLLFLNTVTKYSPTASEKLPTKEQLGLADLSDNQLYIPKIDARAPIIWDVSPVPEENMLESLKLGVVQYNGSSKPDQPAEDGEGNVFIAGHSSYYWWDDGQYKTIFANLDQLENGDEIAIGYNNLVYVYEVFEKIIVNPDDVSVLNQNTEKHIVSLMTCYPIGTNNQRLIVKGELIARGKQ